MIIKAKDWTRPQQEATASINQAVQKILQEIQAKGLQAINNFSEQFDGFKPQVIELKPHTDYQLSDELLQAIETAAARITKFAEFQRNLIQDGEFEDGTGRYAQRIVAIENMAAYIPGGRFPLLSTALMTLIPAKVAGCQRRVALSPSDHPAVLAAASLAGATQFIHIGGVQAIAAFAYGSELAEAVDMIVGPGNAYVNAAKGLVQGQVKIDTLAGPSELLVTADESAPIEWLLYDMMAQSEHDPMALSVMVSESEDYLKQIEQAIVNNEEAKKLADAGNIQLVLAEDVEDCIRFNNFMAPEHLLLCHKNIHENDLYNYGSLFVGKYSAVAYGDYCSGPNHTLPTMGYAKMKGGLSVHDFLKVLTVQEISEQGNDVLKITGLPMAKEEGLILHWESMDRRK